MTSSSARLDRLSRGVCALAAVGLGIGLLTGCGRSAAPVATSTRPSAQLATRLLPTGSFPPLTARTSSLDPATLAAENGRTRLPALLTAMGYSGGVERTFQGPSPRLTFIDERVLAFATAAGARRYVTDLRRHAAAQFGIGVAVRPLAVLSGSGWGFDPPACACHRANPVRTGVVHRGANVVWVAVNGPRATWRALRQVTTSALTPLT